MSNDVNPNESGGKKYVAPEATRLGNVSTGRGYDCSGNGSGAPSNCTTGSWATSCTNGDGTGEPGGCYEQGSNAGNCATGIGAFGGAGCHPGSSAGKCKVGS